MSEELPSQQQQQQQQQPCELLPWDSDLFGFPIARVIEPLLTPERCLQIEQQCRAQRVRCLYFRATADDPTTTALAQQHGFRLVDVRTTLDREFEVGYRPRAAVASRIRRASEADLPRLEEIAARTHRNTRFFYDGRFPPDRCEELYRTWIRKHAGNSRDDVAVAEVEGQIAGYSASTPPQRGVGFISLTAVAQEFRGRGVGDDIVNASLAWIQDQGASSAGVTTQGWNIAAQRLYQRCGFRTSIVDLVFHKWFD